MQQANGTLHWGVQKNMTHSTAGLIVDKRRPCRQHSTVGSVTAIHESQLGVQASFMLSVCRLQSGCGAEYDSEKVINHQTLWLESTGEHCQQQHEVSE